jgi:hypothetical protein
MMPPRPHIEMNAIDFQSGWEQAPGPSQGVEIKMLANDLDEERKTGARTRLVRFAPGSRFERVLVHDYWEDVFLLEGTLTTADGVEPASDGRQTYSCRPPGTFHGPFRSETGCLLLEVQYYVVS